VVDFINLRRWKSEKTGEVVSNLSSLLANGGGQRASPQAKIRLQASSYKGKARSLPL
jgi:hypothetical protein